MGKKEITIAIVAVLVVLVVALMNPYRGFRKGWVFLDQMNAHGAVRRELTTESPKLCKKQCENDAGCQGVAFNKSKAVCYLTGDGNYWNRGTPGDYGWAKSRKIPK